MNTILLITLIILGLIFLGALVGIGFFVKSIFDNRKYDREQLPDLESIDVEEEQLPELDIEESTFSEVDQDISEKTTADLFAEISKQRAK